MSEALKNINVQSKIRSLDLVSFNVENRDDESIIVDPIKITYEIRVNFKVEERTRILTFNCPIKVFGDPEKTKILGSIETKAEFEVINFNDIVKSEKGIPTPMMATFVGILISSTRGMLTILSKGTTFEQGILPIINPMVFFQQNPQQNPKV